MALTKVKASNITLSTPAASSNDTTPATTAYVTTALANLVDSAPSTLNTLNELAAALGDDANFSTTVTNSIAAKAPLASPTFTSNINGGDGVELRLGDSQDILFKHHASGYGHLQNQTGTFYIDSETFEIRSDIDDLAVAIGIDASQNITTGGHITVNNPGSDRKLATTRTGGKTFSIEHDTSGFYVYNVTDSSLQMKFANGGNVGIGTNSPARTLHVQSSDANIASFEGHQGEGLVIVSNTDGRVDIIGYDDGASSYNPVVLRGHTSDGLVCDTNGRVGIGTGSSADTQLHVKNTGSIELRLEADSNNSGQEDCFVRFYTDGKTQEGLAGMDNNNSSTLFGSNTENAMVFGTVSNLPTLFATNNTERMKINAGGDIEVQSASGSELKVNATASGSNDVGLSTQLPGYAANLYSNFFSSGNNIYFVLGGSYVSYIASNGTYNVSDERLKENVTDLTGSLDKIKQLRGVNFTWKDSNRGVGNNIGFIAQEVESIIPEVVNDGGLPNDENGEAPMKHVSYEHVVPHLVEAIKELEARVKELEG